MIETMSKLRNAPARGSSSRRAASLHVEEARRGITEIPVEEAKPRHEDLEAPDQLDRPIGESEDSYFGDFIEDVSAGEPACTPLAANMLRGADRRRTRRR